MARSEVPPRLLFTREVRNQSHSIHLPRIADCRHWVCARIADEQTCTVNVECIPAKDGRVAQVHVSTHHFDGRLIAASGLLNRAAPKRQAATFDQNGRIVAGCHKCHIAEGYQIAGTQRQGR